MKRFTIVIMLILCFGILASCNAENAKSTLDVSAIDIVKAIDGSFDLKGALIYNKDEEDTTDMLEVFYGITDTSILSDFAFSTPAERQAATIAVLKVNNKSDIEGIKTIIKDFYIQSYLTLFKPYLPEMYAIVEKYSFIEYDNALILVVYDTTGNTEILNKIEELNK